MSEFSYEDTYGAIVSACASVNIEFGATEDGRIASAVMETEYLDKLKARLLAINPAFQVERPRARCWYDVRINGIPINLKLTTGGTDNAFNKTAIAYSMSGEEMLKKNMNFNKWFQYLRDMVKKESREIASEYHYLVLNKNTGAVLFKSIFDIHSYKSNPCNDMQISWAQEFLNADYRIAESEYKGKVRELLKTVQKSVRQLMESMKEFADADIDALF